MDMIRTISSSGKDADATAEATTENNRSQQIGTVSGFVSESQQIESDDMCVIAGPATFQEGSSSIDSPAEILPYVEPEATAVDDEDEEEEEEDDYEYEDDDDAAFSGFLVNNPSLAVAQSTATTEESAAAPATIRDEEEPVAEETLVSRPSNKQKWRQPSKQAVNMSLRAEQETTGGKRRLAQDLYRIMNQDTVEAGFSLQPAEEDCMSKWTIKLFQFDEDSNLAKDMLVLGLDNIELEMSFPEQYPFEPPFVRVSRPRFKRQTGFVMNGALCMELLTKVSAC
jgi:ubiquitin-protein ligase